MTSAASFRYVNRENLATTSFNSGLRSGSQPHAGAGAEPSTLTAMPNPFRNLDDIQRDLGDLVVEITQAHFVHFRAPTAWQPAVNAFRCGDDFVICIDLAGVDKSEIDVRVEARRLIVRGSRPVPEPACDEGPKVHVLALEIDHGRFERVLDLPADVDPARVTAEHRNGLLWIKLPLRPHA
jgi:HSP20 family protein